MNISKWIVFGLFTMSLTSCLRVGEQSSVEKCTPQCGDSGLVKVSVEDYVRVGMSLPEFVCVARKYNRNPRFTFPVNDKSKANYFCFEKNGKTYYARSLNREKVDELKIVDSTRTTYDKLMTIFPLSEWERIKDEDGNIILKHSLPATDLDGIMQYGSPTASFIALKKMYMSAIASCTSAIPIYDGDAVCGVALFERPVYSTEDGTIFFRGIEYGTEPAIVDETMIDGERALFWMPPLELDESYSAEDCYSDADNPVDTDIEKEAFEAVSTGNLTRLSSFGINPYFNHKLYATVGDCSIIGTMAQFKDENVNGKFRCEISDVQVKKRIFLRKCDFDSYRAYMKREEVLSLFGYPNANWPEDLDNSSDFGDIGDSVCGNYRHRVFAYPVYSDCVEKPTNDDIVAIAVIHFELREGNYYVSSGIEFHENFYEWNLPRY